MQTSSSTKAWLFPRFSLAYRCVQNIYVYMCVCMHGCMCIVRQRLTSGVFLRHHPPLCLCVWAHVCAGACVCICVYEQVCVHVQVYVCTCICVHMEGRGQLQVSPQSPFTLFFFVVFFYAFCFVSEAVVSVCSPGYPHHA